MGIAASLVTFQPLAADDLPLPWAWLDCPHVGEWWGDAPATRTELAAQCAAVLAGAGRAAERSAIALAVHREDLARERVRVLASERLAGREGRVVRERLRELDVVRADGLGGVAV
jgi:hypothetical protein